MIKLAALVTAAALLATQRAVTEAGTVEAGVLTTVSVYAPLYDTRVSADNGCDPIGCSGNLTRDGDLATLDSRWSCKPELGTFTNDSMCSITYNLSDSLHIEELNIAMYKGNGRTRNMGIYVDGVFVTSWISSGTTLDFETVALDVTGNTIELRGVLEYSEWLSIMEVEIMVISDGSSPTPAPTGDLEPVGLIPLASTGCSSRASERYYAKDNDMSTSWTCDYNPNRNDDCKLVFNLFWYRHIKQVKIALSNGADAEVLMKIGTDWHSKDLPLADNHIHQPYERFVTSSGSTTDFETYEFDVFTKRIVVAGNESISIAEVEFIEEVQAGEIPVMTFQTPYNSRDGTIDTVVTDRFEWWSKSGDALDGDLVFKLSTWSSLTSVGLQFPTGDIYQFELHFYTLSDGAYDPFMTLTGLESKDTSDWQTFEVQLNDDQTVTEVRLIMKGTISGASGFHLLDAAFMGIATDNPTDTFYVASSDSCGLSFNNCGHGMEIGRYSAGTCESAGRIILELLEG